jgi:hypothetical protein
MDNGEGNYTRHGHIVPARVEIPKFGHDVTASIIYPSRSHAYLRSVQANCAFCRVEKRNL